MIKGWSEGVQLMVVGEKRRFWIPQDLAYAGQAGRPAGMLVFDVELLEIQRVADAPRHPDVAAAPGRRARGRASGLAYKVLRPGEGRRAPDQDQPRHRALHGLDHRRQDVRQLGRRAASPPSFGLDDVIAGWTEGLQLMVVGEKTRFWIPERLAYKGRHGPKGMLVFDVELLSATVGR